MQQPHVDTTGALYRKPKSARALAGKTRVGFVCTFDAIARIDLEQTSKI